ncbi:hypothetical protein D3C78_1464720 [compost metagenome]
MKAMTSPTRNSPFLTRTVPMTRMIIIETVEAVRFRALAKAHQSSTGYCALKSFSVKDFSAFVSASMRL